MLRRVMIAGVVISLAAVWAVAATPNPVDGHWQGTIGGPNGDMTINFTFKADGAKLTGTVATPNGDVPLENGKVDGDKIYFETHFQDSVIKHDGTIDGDTIKLKVNGPWGDSDMTLKRVAEEKKSEK